MSTPLTNIRVFVQWTDQTVFAGEDVECEITFKNITSNPSPPRTLLHPPAANGFVGGSERQRKSPVSQIRNSNGLNLRPPPPARGHRGTLSLSAPVGVVRSPAGPESWTGGHTKASRSASTHKRSVSIISIGASESIADDVASHGSVADGPQRMMGPHKRSASLQILPRRNGMNGPSSAPLSQRFTSQPSPLITSTSPTDPTLPERPARRRTGTATAPTTPSLRGSQFARRGGSASFSQGFKFPAAAPPSDERMVDTSPVQEPGYSGTSVGMLSPRSKDTIPIISEQGAQAPAAKILSPTSIVGTPRSSGEFYSLSNNSTETIASEYVPPASGPPPFASHVRRPSNLAPVNSHRPPEVLMMGYAQIHGSFTLDGSLISQSPFDEVKRKGAVGGQGGGVIGVDTNKRDGRLLRSFGWGNIGESIGGLLGGGELSSMKEMRGIASSRSIPLLSTPQSILFVDLRLAPGESRSYKYSFRLPKGLPPSHRGKAIKITYRLVIGTQRPGGAKEQQVKSVEVPFRILGSVNSHGELLGHDLMSPYIILRDQARIRSIQTASTTSLDSPRDLKERAASKPNESSLDDFLSYVDELLSKSRQNSSLGLLSPTDARTHRQSYIEEPSTAKEAIDMAILRSNTTTEFQQSANRFEIARSGRRVAVVMLARPAYRLGETITAAIDFSNADIPCYAIHAALETSEKVDPSIALRSEASILRATRRIYASHSESSLFARRLLFAPSIPVSATPEFITSGVSLEWCLRIEFVTPRLSDDEGEPTDARPILEQVSRDDRGIILAAKEVLDCESFEICVPLTVYGAVAGTLDKEERESSPEGLAV